MSLCYDFQKWLMVTLAMVAVSVTVGLGQYAHGQTNGLYECVTSFNRLYTLMNQQYSANLNMSDPQMNVYIKSQCNFYHERTGIWVDAMGEPPDPYLVGQFHLLYDNSTEPESMKEFEAMTGLKQNE
jgi:hypothetical protein